MIGPMEIVIIVIAILFLFRADEMGQLLQKIRKVRSQYREIKHQVTQEVIQPLRTSVEETTNTILKEHEKH